MKKLWISAILLLMLLAVLPVSAATSETTAANALYSLDLVSGYDDSGTDFGLDDALTRAQAVVLIERYLGVAAEAASTTEKAPFGDVPAWADPYVAYAVTNGLVSGKKDMHGVAYFDPDARMSEKEFLTLLLRAMEYTDKNDGSGDFIWSDPFALAKKIGLIEHAEENADFVRGDAFVACSNALEGLCKGGKTVSEKLIDAKVITEKAYGYAKRIANGDTIVVACVGDSVTQGTGSSNASLYSYPAQLQKLLGKGFQVVNCGKASSYVMNPSAPYNAKKSSPNLWYPNTVQYKTLMDSNADIVIVMLGTNDARSMTHPDAETDFVSDYKALIRDIQGMSSKPDIYLSTMIPAVNATITNEGTVYTLPRLIRSIAAELQLPLIETDTATQDYYSVYLPNGDSVHPKDDTYPMLAINFYNEVFDHNKALPELPKAAGDVVYVSMRGKATNGGTSPEDAVNNFGLAVAMLRENGGTVVVSGPLTVKGTYLVKCGGPVTVTSVYDGVDYGATASAALVPSGSLTLASDFCFENVSIQPSASACYINCNYNDLTIGEGVTSPSKNLPSINVGYRLESGAMTPEEVSCHADCTVRVASGKWLVIRGGNMRTNGATPIGTIDKGVKLSIFISGGEFTYTGVNANTAIGMNGSEGDVYFEISGGNFIGGVYGISRTGTNTTGIKPVFSGNFEMKVTGGTFKDIGLYHTADTPTATGTTVLTITKELSSVAKTSDFATVNVVE